MENLTAYQLTVVKRLHMQSQFLMFDNQKLKDMASDNIRKIVNEHPWVSDWLNQEGEFA